ncbi:hypothetical protein N658DRAFT_509047 [Parathielavia hyrcaniae]|uniref:Uncharacterized protein n=1 Tax=Parathielavia hyrcaniae TaxID=113614 RepID=A0AAN6PW05_9PEZI|nr:hypothetical protein N658DRAFT_509047 [Parathielavia hyrcaniae]
MSAEAPKLETPTSQPPTEQQQQQPQDQQKPAPSEADQSMTDEKAAKPTTDSETAPAPEEKKPNPLKKALSVFKTLFKCLRKPTAREVEDQAAERVVEEGKASAAAPAAGEEKVTAGSGDVPAGGEGEKEDAVAASKDGEAVKAL